MRGGGGREEGREGAQRVSEGVRSCEKWGGEKRE